MDIGEQVSMGINCHKIKGTAKLIVVPYSFGNRVRVKIYTLQ